jgi:hypothetical protein
MNTESKGHVLSLVNPTEWKKHKMCVFFHTIFEALQGSRHPLTYRGYRQQWRREISISELVALPF